MLGLEDLVTQNTIPVAFDECPKHNVGARLYGATNEDPESVAACLSRLHPSLRIVLDAVLWGRHTEMRADFKWVATDGQVTLTGGPRPGLNESAFL